MPLPRPRPNESKDAFLSRCMDSEAMKREFSDQSQRYAVCNQRWESRETTNEVVVNRCKMEGGGEITLLQSSLSLTNTARRQWLGQEYIVAPVVLMVEGVHCGSAGCAYYPAEELARFPEAWNSRPLPVFHPQRQADGAYISCNHPEVIERQCVGQLFNTRYEHPRLRGELWINVARCREIAPEVLTYVNSNRILEVSTGLFNDWEESPGVWNGEEYSLVVRNIRPDHLALLPGGVGACSVEDGCGVRANSAAGPETVVPIERKRGDEKKMGENKTVSVNDGGAGGGEREWVALRRLSKSWLTDNEAQASTILTNELGYTELASQIQRKLDALDTGERLHYLEELFDNSFIYRVNIRGDSAASMGSDTVYYRRSYSTNQQTGEVVFGDDATRVRKEVSYSPISSTNLTSDPPPPPPSTTNAAEGGGEEGEEEGATTDNDGDKGTTSDDNNEGKETEAMARKDKVDAMIANTNLPYGEEDREMLMALQDSCFEQVENTCNRVIDQIDAANAAAAAEGSKGATTNAAQPPQPQGLEEWLEQTNAPAEFKQLIQNSVRKYNEEREKKIAKIVDNSQFSAEELRASQDQFLDRLYETISKPVYLGGGGGPPAANTRFEGEEPLEVPVINWKG